MTSFQIECFLTVAKYLNFTEAANHLYIAQSSLSRNISNLEEELEFKLFVRTKKYVRLTPAGATFFEEFSKLTVQAKEAIQKAQQAHADLEGLLRIGLVENQRSESFLPQCVSALRKDLPKLKLNLIRGNFKELRMALACNEIDIAMTIDFDIDEYKDQNVLYQPFYTAEGRCVISKFHPLADQEIIQLEHLKELPLIAISPDLSNGAFQHLLDLCHIHGYTPPHIYYADSVENLILMVESGLGYSVLDENSSIMISSAVRAIPINDHGPVVLLAVWHKSNLNPAIPLFVNILIAHSS